MGGPSCLRCWELIYIFFPCYVREVRDIFDILDVHGVEDIIDGNLNSKVNYVHNEGNTKSMPCMGNKA